MTLPGARYGLISAAFVVFNLVITDFGAPKVIGGQYNVLALRHLQAGGRPAELRDGRGGQRGPAGPGGARVLRRPLVQRGRWRCCRRAPCPTRPSRAGLRPGDAGSAARSRCSSSASSRICQYAALVKFWPYNLELRLKNYQFDLKDGGGWASYYNSIRMALYTAAVGTAIVFVGAYVVEKARGLARGRAAFQFLAMMPMAVPGMVLGLAYIFFFNDPANPLNVIYGTMAILVINTVTHFYTVAHLTALTALKQMDPGVRGGLGLAQAAGVPDLLAGHGPGLPAGDPRHRDLPVRQRHDHGLGGGVPLRAAHHAGLGRGPEHGRRRRDRAGRGDGDDDLLHQRRRRDRGRGGGKQKKRRGGKNQGSGVGGGGGGGGGGGCPGGGGYRGNPRFGHRSMWRPAGAALRPTADAVPARAALRPPSRAQDMHQPLAATRLPPKMSQGPHSAPGSPR